MTTYYGDYTISSNTEYSHSTLRCLGKLTINAGVTLSLTEDVHRLEAHDLEMKTGAKIKFITSTSDKTINPGISGENGNSQIPGDYGHPGSPGSDADSYDPKGTTGGMGGNGGDATAGKNGESADGTAFSTDDGQNASNGGNGGAGGKGGDGNIGKDFPSVEFIIHNSVRMADNENQITFNGANGGNGGDGGDGGNGGNGGDGGDGHTPIIGSGGDGGDAGDGGNGGNGGAGGAGGQPGTAPIVSMVVPLQHQSQLNLPDQNAFHSQACRIGHAGRQGRGGNGGMKGEPGEGKSGGLMSDGDDGDTGNDGHDGVGRTNNEYPPTQTSDAHYTNLIIIGLTTLQSSNVQTLDSDVGLKRRKL